MTRICFSIKKALSIMLVLLLIFNINAYAGVKSPYGFRSLTIQSIKSVTVQPGFIGPGNVKDNIIYNLNSSKQKNIVMTILRELKTGKIKGNEKYGFVSHAYSPARIIILLKNGKSLYLTSSFNIKTKKLSEDQTQIINVNISEQITVSNEDRSINIRLICPKTKKLVESYEKFKF